MDLLSLSCHLSMLLESPPGLLAAGLGLLAAGLGLPSTLGLPVGLPTLLGCLSGDDGTADLWVPPEAGAVARRLTTILDGFVASCCIRCCSVSVEISSLSLPGPEDDDE